MGKLHDKMREDLELRGMRANTVSSYLRCANTFAKHFNRSPEQLGAPEIRQFFLYLKDTRKVSPATFNVYGGAIRFLYRVTLNRPVEVSDLPRMKVPMRLPTILSGTEVERLLGAIESPKHRAMTMLAYGAGLRVSEIAKLDVGDIDSKRMVIHVRDTKRGRERYVMLSPILLQALRAHWKASRPKSSLLFPGRQGGKTITRAAISKALKKSVEKVGLAKRITPHTLRHAFATHMLEGGVDLRTLQVVLGHGSLRSTMTYAHVTTARVQVLHSPLDDLGTSRGRRYG
jgi:site-specific recombinase XerD